MSGVCYVCPAREKSSLRYVFCPVSGNGGLLPLLGLQVKWSSRVV